MKRLLLIISLIASVVQVGSGQGLPGVTEVRLENGLKVLLREAHSVPVVSVGCWYRVGSKDEPIGMTGISHWVEHMNFMGTQSFTRELLHQAIEAAGGIPGGFTSLDQTAYFTTVTSSALESLLKLEAERMTQSLFDPVEVTSQRNVILAEWRRAADDSRNWLDMEVTAASLKMHPYRWPAAGWLADLERLNRDQLLQYYQRYYSPNNAILVLVGDFQSPAALESVKKHFGPIPRKPDPARVLSPEPASSGERRVKVIHEGLTPYLEISYPAPDILNDEYFALLLLDAALVGVKDFNPESNPWQGSAAKSSRLYRDLVDKNLASQVSSSLLPTQNPYLYKLMAALPDAFQYQPAEEAVYEELERIKNYGLSDYELTKARNQLVARAFLDQDSVTKLARQLGFFESIASSQLLAGLEDKINKIGNDDLRRVAVKYFAETSRTVGWFFPAKRQQRIEVEKLSSLNPNPQVSASLLRPAFGRELFLSDGAKKKSKKESLPAPPALPPDVKKEVPAAFQLPELPDPPIAVNSQRRVLPNGIMVLAAENKVSPTFTLVASLKAGAMRDRDESAGVANFVARMLERGVKGKNVFQVAEGFDFLGARFHAGIDYLTATFTVSGLSKDAPSLIQQLADLLQNPTFPPAEVEKLRTAIQGELRQNSEDPQGVAELALRERIYPVSHPFRRNVKGTARTLERIKPADLIAFYKRYYRPDQLLIAVAGAVNPDLIFQTIETSLGKWSASGAPEAFSIPVAPPELGKGLQVVRMNQKNQCALVMGMPGVSRRNADYYPMLVLSQILGQAGTDGRLSSRLKDQDGLVSYVYTSMEASLSEGPWAIWAGVAPDKVELAVAGIQKEIERIKEEGITASELAAAQRRLVHRLPIEIESNEGLARQLRLAELYELGAEFLSQYAGLIKGVTLDNLTDCLRTHLAFDRSAIVVAGPPASSQGN